MAMAAEHVQELDYDEPLQQLNAGVTVGHRRTAGPDNQDTWWLGDPMGFTVWPWRVRPGVGIDAPPQVLANSVGIIRFRNTGALFPKSAAIAAEFAAAGARGQAPGNHHTVRVMDISPRMVMSDGVVAVGAAVLTGDDTRTGPQRLST